MSCGTPVIAYDVTGPRDILTPGVSGYCSEKLSELCEPALLLDRQAVYDDSTQWTWERVAEIFLDNIVLHPGTRDLRSMDE